ncbi:MAG: hypothetical protein ACFFD4_25530, partial [Candidatus Odinarchaeota archaeon]
TRPIEQALAHQRSDTLLILFLIATFLLAANPLFPLAFIGLIIKGLGFGYMNVKLKELTPSGEVTEQTEVDSKSVKELVVNQEEKTLTIVRRRKRPVTIRFDDIRCFFIQYRHGGINIKHRGHICYFVPRTDLSPPVDAIKLFDDIKNYYLDTSDYDPKHFKTVEKWLKEKTSVEIIYAVDTYVEIKKWKDRKVLMKVTMKYIKRKGYEQYEPLFLN